MVPPVPLSPPASALQLLPPEAQPLSPAARAYNLQLGRIDKLRSQLAGLESLAQAHRMALHAEVGPLRRQWARVQRDLVLALDAHLQGKLLGGGLARTARAQLCALAAALARDGDPEMRELHDRHSPRTLAQLQQDAAIALRQRLEAALGERIEDEGQGLGAEQLARVGLERLRQAQAEQAGRRREAAQARRARRQSGAAVHEAGQHDADTLLRRLFRQLASALHPDREADPQRRLRKTALMSEANAAYEKRDLVALLQIQGSAELVGVDRAPGFSDERLASLTLLLKAQVANMERERAARQRGLADEFDLADGVVANEHTLRQQRIDQARALQAALAETAHDLAQMDDVARLKRWLNARRDPG